MLRKNYVAFVVLGAILLNAVFSLWLYGHQSALIEKSSSTAGQHELLASMKRQSDFIEALQQDSAALKERLSASLKKLESPLTKSDVITMLQELEPEVGVSIKALQAQISEVQQQLELVAQKATENEERKVLMDSQVAADTDTLVENQQIPIASTTIEVETPELNPQQLFQQFTQQEAEQQQNIQMHIQQMDSHLLSTPDYVGASNVESAFQSALDNKVQENAALPVSLSSVNCSGGLCKVSLSGNMDGDNPAGPGPLLQLLALGVIPDNTDFMTVPTESGLDIYLGQNGQALPQVSQ